MPRIILHSPVGREAPHAEGLAPMADPRGNRVAFLFNGHVSAMPFWKNLEQEVMLLGSIRMRKLVMADAAMNI